MVCNVFCEFDKKNSKYFLHEVWIKNYIFKTVFHIFIQVILFTSWGKMCTLSRFMLGWIVGIDMSHWCHLCHFSWAVFLVISVHTWIGWNISGCSVAGFFPFVFPYFTDGISDLGVCSFICYLRELFG